MLKIGLTGGIGSGKSTVAGIFKLLGIPVYNADVAARQLMNTSPKIKEAIIKNFGPAAYVNNELNRKYIGSVVFNDKEKLELLNSITHPATIEDAEKWMHEQNAPYVLKEAALLYESGANKNMDYVIGVYAPLQLRISRVMKRDNVSADEVLKRMNRQMNEESKMKQCDFIITNNDQELVIPQVLELDKKLRTL